jgi:DNA-binding CsgD family transcriptional regulator
MLDAYQFHLKLRRLRSLASMVSLFRSTIAPFGFDTFACGELDLTERARSVFYVIGWPDRWRDFYLKSGLIQRDPIVDTLAYRREPYTWSDLRRDRKFGKLGRDVLKQAAVHGWTEGLVVPMPSNGSRLGLVSLAGTCEELAAEAQAYLTLISIGFQMHARAMVGRQGFAVPPAGLTQREIDSVRLVAQGHSDKTIASRLGVAPSTSHEFIEKAKRRLRARTRMQMVAIAVSLGIVDPFQAV